MKVPKAVSEAARILAGKRKNHNGGRPAVDRVCEHCQAEIKGTQKYRQHVGPCKKRRLAASLAERANALTGKPANAPKIA